MKKKSRNFTLLEVMLGISLLAIASGALFWRLQKMVERNRFDSDANRFHSTLILTRSLAINTKMDYRLELHKAPEGWIAHLFCREDPDLTYSLPRYSLLDIAFNKAPIRDLSIDFYSSGFVGPKGLLALSHGSQVREFKFPGR